MDTKRYAGNVLYRSTSSYSAHKTEPLCIPYFRDFNHTFHRNWFAFLVFGVIKGYHLSWQKIACTGSRFRVASIKLYHPIFRILIIFYGLFKYNFFVRSFFQKGI